MVRREEEQIMYYPMKLETSGRTIEFVRAPNGSRDAIPTTGPRSLDDSEWNEMVSRLNFRNTGQRFAAPAAS